MTAPLITVAVPSFNQGRFLDDALQSLFSQGVPLEVFVLDGGSSDNTLQVLQRWAPSLSGWRSHADAGQAAAINEGIAGGSAPYVCWLNSDDWLLPEALHHLLAALEQNPGAPAAYGRAWNVREGSGKRRPVWVEPFVEKRLATRCIIAQPATLIRRTAWEAVGGVAPDLDLAMYYDLWWKLYRHAGAFAFVDHFLAVNREHPATKTRTRRRQHYQEAIQVVRRHYGRVPLKWWLAQPYAVWFKSLIA